MSILAQKHTDERTIWLQWSMQIFIVAYPMSWKQHEESFFSGIIRQPQTKTFSIPINRSFRLLLFNYVWLFMSFQAAEKALKAMQYNVDANQKTNDHNLCQNCCDFDDHELTQLAGQLEGLVVNSAHMRYPDTMSYPKIPNDVYTAEKAEKALDLARDILERVKVELT